MPERSDSPDLQKLVKDVAGTAREAAFVAVGLGVMGYQRAQVQRAALQKALSGKGDLGAVLHEVRTEVSRHVGEVDDAVGTVVGRLRTSLEPLERQLPPPAREAAQRVHEQADEIRARLRHLLEVPPVAQPPADQNPPSAAEASEEPGDAAGSGDSGDSGDYEGPSASQ
ncbi:MAG TPA: hypothetical protein VGL60_08555 [Acidimicrobiales bacterium]|jgi:hypothetical protein